MKSYVAAAAIFAAAVSAQSITDLPSCSLSCLVTDVPQTGCAVTDFSCACAASGTLVPLVTPCVQKACDTADQQTTIQVLEGICASVGEPFTLSSSAAVSTPASSSSAAASSSAAVSTSAASSSAAVSTPASSSSAAASSSAVSLPGTSSVCTLSTTSVTVTAVGTGSSKPTGSTNGTVTTAAPTAFTGAASANGVTFGAAGVLGLLAYLL